jgi:hypothetical protein
VEEKKERGEEQGRGARYGREEAERGVERGKVRG